jgi:23S rRNA (guanosine2251-2'-O)-methyltransferase
MSKQRSNQQIISGPNSLSEALAAAREVTQIFIAEGAKSARIDEILLLAEKRKISIKKVARKELEQIVGNSNHQGVAAIVEAYSYVSLEDLIESTKDTERQPLLIMLDELEDPHNLGAILRTADAVAADGIIIPNRRSVGLTTTVAKISVGAIEHVPVAQVTNLVQTVERLKKEGFWIVGADASGKQLYSEIDYNMSVCLVIGSEGQGISRLLLKNCDYVVRLPMRGHVNSLNASVATSIFLYEIYRQRGY